MREFVSRLDGLSRRRLLERAACTALGVGMMNAVGSKAAATPAGNPRQRRLIYLYMRGGMTHLDTFDPKPGSDAQGPTTAIGTSVPGIQFGQYLPLLATRMDRLAVIRSMNTQTADHEGGEYLMRTSYEAIATERHPSIGPWMQRLRGRQNKTLPDTVTIGGSSRHPMAGFLDPSFSPLPIGDPERGLENTKPPADRSEQSFEKRIALIDGFDRTFREKYPLKQVRAYTDFYDEATTLLASSELKAFDLGLEKPEIRDRYGRNPFGQGCLLARRLIENNVQCVEVTQDGWDMHYQMWAGNMLPAQAGVLDKAVHALLTDLEAIGLLDDTVVVLTTEFGRTPNINLNVGRDHHPAAFSAMLAGGGIAGGQVYGKSDDRGHSVDEDGASVADLNATVASALGLKLDEVIHSPTGRPFKVAHDGAALTKLLS